MSNTISDEWKKWALENIAIGGEAEELVCIMLKNGLDEKVSRAAIDEIKASPYLSVVLKYQQKLQKREWLLKTLDTQRRNIDSYTNPKKSPLPPFQKFLEEYYFENKIGFFSGAIKNWNASKWTFSDLVEKVGYDSIVEVQAGRESMKDYEIKSHFLRTKIKFGEFVEKITSVDSTNDIYMTANNQPFKNPAMQILLSDFENIGDGYFDMQTFADRAFLWIGPKGVITPLHHDLTNNFFIQIHGKKTYHLIPSMQVPYMYNNNHVFSDIGDIKPSESELVKFNEFNKASIIKVELEPGDSLFIPIGYWHHVVGRTPNISLTITNMNVDNNFPGYPS